jgi:hypothetical protein
MKIIDRVLLEWSYRTKKGYPDINSQEDMDLFESMFGFNMLLKESRIQVAARAELISASPGNFAVQSKPDRIQNINKVSSQNFVEIIKSTFNIEDVKVHPPNTGPNKKSISSKASTKFDMFEFEYEGKQTTLLLVGGASANKGQKFENRIYLELKEAAGLDINDIENPQIVQLLRFLKLDPKTYSESDVAQTGGKDTKRPLNLDKGPEDNGSTISDVEIKGPGNTYYLSVKDKTGDNIYNGGNVSSIRYNDDKTEVILDRDTFNADVTKARIFKMFSIDPEKHVEGLNYYMNKTGIDPGYISVDFDKEDVSKMIGTAVDYGYVYVREESDNSLKLINIASAEDTYKLTGSPTEVLIRYANKVTKTTSVLINLQGSTAGFKKVLIEIRNAQGGLVRPSIKAKIL